MSFARLSRSFWISDLFASDNMTSKRSSDNAISSRSNSPPSSKLTPPVANAFAACQNVLARAVKSIKSILSSLICLMNDETACTDALIPWTIASANFLATTLTPPAFLMNASNLLLISSSAGATSAVTLFVKPENILDNLVLESLNASTAFACAAVIPTPKSLYSCLSFIMSAVIKLTSATPSESNNFIASRTR